MDLKLHPAFRFSNGEVAREPLAVAVLSMEPVHCEDNSCDFFRARIPAPSVALVAKGGISTSLSESCEDPS